MTKEPTAGIILAAGMSKRLGEPKQLLELGGRCLIEWVLDATLGSKLEKIVLVLGHYASDILRALGEKSRSSQIEVVINPDYEEGMSTSLSAGFAKVKDEFSSVMFLLGDQPLISSQIIDYLLDKFWRSKKEICVPVFKGERRNPTVFGKELYEHFKSIKGDIGAREIIEAYPEMVLDVKIDDPWCFLDIDTKTNLEVIKSYLDQKIL